MTLNSEKTASPRKGEIPLPGIGHEKMNRRNLSQRESREEWEIREEGIVMITLSDVG